MAPSMEPRMKTAPMVCACHASVHIICLSKFYKNWTHFYSVQITFGPSLKRVKVAPWAKLSKFNLEPNVLTLFEGHTFDVQLFLLWTEELQFTYIFPQLLLHFWEHKLDTNGKTCFSICFHCNEKQYWSTDWKKYDFNIVVHIFACLHYILTCSILLQLCPIVVMCHEFFSHIPALLCMTFRESGSL